MDNITTNSGNAVKDAIAGAQEVKESNAEAVERLARLPVMEYEQVRNTEAKSLGVRAQVLDDEVRKARPQNHTTDDSMVDDLGMFDPHPSDQPVDGGDLLQRIVQQLQAYVVLPAYAAESIALWILHSHAPACGQHSPRLSVSSAEKGSGKSTLLDLLEPLTPRAIKCESLSTAVMFRLIDSRKPTLLIDEADSFLKENEELRGCINAGFSRNAKHLRCEGDDHQVKAFKTFGPVVLAGIGGLPDTIQDRSISIKLKRKLDGEVTSNFRSDRVGHLHELACEAQRWVMDNEASLQDHDPKMPDGVVNRRADVWRPLLAIADAIGGEWPQKARLAAAHFAGAGEDSSIRVQLLSDIRDIFARRNLDTLSSAEICDELTSLEARPWCEWKKGRPITPAQLARQLSGFAIAPSTVRSGMSTFKGYKRSKFQDTFERYLPPISSRHTSQARDTAGYSDFAAVTETEVLRQENPENPSISAGCDVCRLESGGDGEQHGISASEDPKTCVQCGGTIPADAEPIPASGGNWLHADGDCYDQYLAAGRRGGAA